MNFRSNSGTGSNAVGQYFSPLREEFDNIETCPEKYLLWFHHVPWDFRLISGRTLFEVLRYHYDFGVKYVTGMRKAWMGFQDQIDPQRFDHVKDKLEKQEENAKLWREVCVEYFGKFVEPGS